MLPAYMLALELNLPICSIFDLIDNSPLRRSGDRQLQSSIQFPHEATSILLVDDSSQSGKTLHRHLSMLPDDIRVITKTLICFSAEDWVNPEVDIALDSVPQPRAFEWNILHQRAVTRHACYDLDGVLCDDPTSEQNDDGPKYLDFIQNAPQRVVPTYRIGAIVTSRLGKYRSETEKWLADHGVEYSNLFMLEDVTAKERKDQGLHAVYKAARYKNERYILFVESDDRQARSIAELTGKSVYCVNTGTMYNAVNSSKRTDRSDSAGSGNHKSGLRESIYRFAYRHPLVKKSLKRLFRFIKRV